MLGVFGSDNGPLEVSVTESWSCTSKLDLDLIGRARRVFTAPCKSLPFSSCPQSWQLTGSWLLPSSAAPLKLQKCLTLSSPQAKPEGFPWLQSRAVAHLYPVVWLGGRRAGRGVCANPSPFLCHHWGCACWKQAKEQVEFRSSLWEGRCCKCS